MQDEVAFVKKYADSDDKNGHIVNAVGEEKYHHCENKNRYWIDKCPDISPEKR